MKKVEIILMQKDESYKTIKFENVVYVATLFNFLEKRIAYIEVYLAEDGKMDGKPFSAKAAFRMDEVANVRVL